MFINNIAFADGAFYGNRMSNIVYDLSTYKSYGFGNEFTVTDTFALLDCYRKVSIDFYYRLPHFGLMDPEGEPLKFKDKLVVYLIYNITFKEQEVQETYTGQYNLPLSQTSKKFIPTIKYIGFVTGDYEFKEDFTVTNAQRFYLKNVSFIKELDNHTQYLINDEAIIETMFQDLTKKFLYAQKHNVLYKFPEAHPAL